MKTNWLDKHLNTMTGDAQGTAGAIIALGEISGSISIPEKSAPVKDQIEAIGNLIHNGQRSFVAAAKIIVALCDQSPNALEMILKRWPEFDAKFLVLLEQVGRGKMHVGVLVIGDQVIRERVARLKYEDQKQVVDGVLPVVKESGDGFREENKRLKEMTRSEISHVIVDGEILSAADQVKEAKRKLETAKAMKQKRFIINYELGTIRFVDSREFKISYLEGVISDAKKELVKNLESQVKSNQLR